MLLEMLHLMHEGFRFYRQRVVFRLLVLVVVGRRLRSLARDVHLLVGHWCLVGVELLHRVLLVLGLVLDGPGERLAWGSSRVVVSVILRLEVLFVHFSASPD